MDKRANRGTSVSTTLEDNRGINRLVDCYIVAEEGFVKGSSSGIQPLLDSPIEELARKS